MKISEYTSAQIVEKYKATFESYWNMSEFQSFDPNQAESLNRLKNSLKREISDPSGEFFFDIQPFGYQQEILDKLEIERSVHKSFRNLVVAATGTGKTVISAFDFKRFYKEHRNAKLLFLAHRKEILEQSLKTFRGILRDGNFADLWVGGEIPSQDDHIFASVQTLNAGGKYEAFKAQHFDYIVLDETHHSTAKTYRRLLEHFDPKILLGLTATPERLDGESILEFFNHRIVDEIRLAEAIDRKMLSPFHYFGVSEETDLRGLRWTSGRYDVGELSNLYIGNQARDQVVLNALNKYCPDKEVIRGLGFCCSQEHAQYMSRVFNAVNIPSAHLNSKSHREERREVAQKLRKGQLNFIFVVDLYNEGVDLPEVNTILFLRPTESPTVFIQQLGRGLRIHEDKEVLTVLDFIGHAHKQYDMQMRFQSLVGKTPHSIRREIESDFPSLPKSCFIQLERVARERIYKNLKATYVNTATLLRYVNNFEYESVLPFTLRNFLNHYHLKPKQVYKFSTLTGLKTPNKLDENPCVHDIKNIHKKLYKFCDVTSVEWIDFLLDFIDHPRIALNQRQSTMLSMTYYTLFNRAAGSSIAGLMNDFVMQNKDICRELKEVLLYNKDQLDHLPQSLEIHKNVPLELHSIYTVDQVLSAMGVHSENKMISFREGVKYVKHYGCDVFFITLNKNEKDYQKSTMYKDYAISERLFHWQSQSRTSTESPTGQRYIYQKENGSKVLLFVREHKVDENRQTMGYRCLGLAEYVSHEGSKPISITYRLKEKMPISVYRESAKLINVI